MATKVVASATTDRLGFYQFKNVPAGSYSVMITTPWGYKISPASKGSNRAKDSDFNPITGTTAAITLTSGANVDSIDAGLFPCK